MATELHHSSHIHVARPQAGVPLQNRAAQALMLVVGLVGTFGVVYFTMVEPEPGISAVDGLVAALLLIGSLGYIAAAPKLSLNDSEIWGAALGFATLRLAMSLVKVIGYGEGDAISFLALDAVITGLLLIIRPAAAPERQTAPQRS
ncbi:MAG: hypothetical protein AB7T32_12700 [Dehalococcoidia bacterium]